MNTVRIVDFLVESFYLIIVPLCFVVIALWTLVWEPLRAFWNKRTWREARPGIFVKDYSALWAWMNGPLREAIYLLLILTALALFYWIG